MVRKDSMMMIGIVLFEMRVCTPFCFKNVVYCEGFFEFIKSWLGGFWAVKEIAIRNRRN